MWLMPWILAAAAAAELPLIRSSELVPGEAGVCVTDMGGGERLEIPLEILGVLDGSAPERELVLVRLQGELPEHTGIVAGMSGSPVYVRGRLLGALAYGWAFAKEPIGGVTPFEKMRALAEPHSGGGSARAAQAARPPLDTLLGAVRDAGAGRMLVDWLIPDQPAAMRHTPLAVAMGGGEIDATPWLAEAWRRLGWVSAPAGRSTAPAAAEQLPLEPGAMMCAVLVDGDATVAAGGTVTAVEGSKIWAFGHPYLGGGEVSLPLARAQVITVLPNLRSSFKFFTVGETVGAVTRDAVHGIYGELGAEAEMLPVAVRADEREYHFRAVPHRVLLPFLVAYLVSSSHLAEGVMFGGQTTTIEMQLRYADGRELRLEESFAGSNAPASAAQYASLVTAYLANTWFPAPELASLAIALRTDNDLQQAVIVDAVADRPVVHPGDELPVRVRIRPREGAEYVHTVTLEIPVQARPGRLELIVADGASWTAYDLQMRPSQTAAFDDELALLERLVPSTRLVTVLEQKELGVALQGNRGSTAAPTGVVMALRSGLGRNLKTTSYRPLVRHEDVMEQPLLGAQRISLELRIDGEPEAEENQ